MRVAVLAVRRRADRQECVDTPALPRPLRLPRQRRGARRRATRHDHGGERPSLVRREDADIEPQRLPGSERQVNQPVLRLAAQHRLCLDLPALHVSRRRRCESDRVVFEDPPHLLAPLLPLLWSLDPRPIVHDEYVGHLLADGQLRDPRHRPHRGRDRRDRDLARIGARGRAGGLRLHCCREYCQTCDGGSDERNAGSLCGFHGRDSSSCTVMTSGGNWSLTSATGDLNSPVLLHQLFPGQQAAPKPVRSWGRLHAVTSANQAPEKLGAAS